MEPISASLSESDDAPTASRVHAPRYNARRGSEAFSVPLPRKECAQQSGRRAPRRSSATPAAAAVADGPEKAAAERRTVDALHRMPPERCHLRVRAEACAGRGHSAVRGRSSTLPRRGGGGEHGPAAGSISTLRASTASAAPAGSDVHVQAADRDDRSRHAPLPVSTSSPLPRTPGKRHRRSGVERHLPSALPNDPARSGVEVEPRVCRWSRFSGVPLPALAVPLPRRCGRPLCWDGGPAPGTYAHVGPRGCRFTFPRMGCTRFPPMRRSPPKVPRSARRWWCASLPPISGYTRLVGIATARTRSRGAREPPRVLPPRVSPHDHDEPSPRLHAHLAASCRPRRVALHVTAPAPAAPRRSERGATVRVARLSDVVPFGGSTFRLGE